MCSLSILIGEGHGPWRLGAEIAGALPLSSDLVCTLTDFELPGSASLGLKSSPTQNHGGSLSQEEPLINDCPASVYKCSRSLASRVGDCTVSQCFPLVASLKTHCLLVFLLSDYVFNNYLLCAHCLSDTVLDSEYK